MNHIEHIRGELFDFNCAKCRKDFVREIQSDYNQDDFLDSIAESLPEGILKMGEYDGTSTS